MLRNMPTLSIPRMSKPWKVAAIIMAVFGFVSGYAGTAGAPYCGSLGQCIERVAVAGPPWFYPASLVPGAVAAAMFAAVVYLLFLLVHSVRTALHRPPAARMDQEPPAAHSSPEPNAAERRMELPAVWNGLRALRPTPLLVAIGAALTWAVLSVGPTNLVSDLGQLVPRDTVTAVTAPYAYCPPGWTLREGQRCWKDLAFSVAPQPALFTEPQCLTSGANPLQSLSALPNLGAVIEADGMCHERSGGTFEPLMDDVVRGGKAGLLAFLAVGAALLLWPRLRAASSR